MWATSWVDWPGKAIINSADSNTQSAPTFNISTSTTASCVEFTSQRTFKVNWVTNGTSVYECDPETVTFYLNEFWGYSSQIVRAPETEEARQERHRSRIREVIRSRSFPGIVVGHGRVPLPSPKDIREQRARETLRRVIGEEKWADFNRKGFIQVRAKSGKFYQIFPGHGITKVFHKGALVERLCVVMRGDFAATDSLIMRYLMVLNNEEDFRKRAVKHALPTFAQQGPKKSNSLVEVSRQIKAA